MFCLGLSSNWWVFAEFIVVLVQFLRSSVLAVWKTHTQKSVLSIHVPLRKLSDAAFSAANFLVKLIMKKEFI